MRNQRDDQHRLSYLHVISLVPQGMAFLHTVRSFASFSAAMFCSEHTPDHHDVISITLYHNPR